MENENSLESGVQNLGSTEIAKKTLRGVEQEYEKKLIKKEYNINVPSFVNYNKTTLNIRHTIGELL